MINDKHAAILQRALAITDFGYYYGIDEIEINMEFYGPKW